MPKLVPKFYSKGIFDPPSIFGVSDPHPRGTPHLAIWDFACLIALVIESMRRGVMFGA